MRDGTIANPLKMNRAGLTLLSFLSASAMLGIAILATDEHLWEHAPSHAYALAAFVALDGALALLVSTGWSKVFTLAFAWGVAQAILMIADIWTAPEFGFTIHDFAFDLFSNWAWDVLLVTQIAISLSSWQGRVIAASCPQRLDH